MKLLRISKSYIKVAASLFFIFATSISAAFLCNPIRDYKLDKLAYSLNDYNKYDYYNDFVNPILRIHQKSSDPKQENRYELYNDAFEEYYYNSFPQCIRQVANNNFEIYDTKVKMFCQKSYTVSNNYLPDGGHYIDYGLFSAYYADDILGPRKYLFERYGCASFVYISDKFADLLLERYGINSYEELIRDERYCVLPLYEDGTLKCNVCINNIIYSSKRDAWRVKQLYGDYFALMNISKFNKSKYFADVSLEFDIKVDPFGTKKLLNGLKEYGYDVESTTYDFYTFDRSQNKYILNEKITIDYKNIESDSTSVFFICFIFISIGLFILMIWSFRFSKKEKILFWISLGISSLIFGIITSVLYFYVMWSILPIILILIAFIETGIFDLLKEKKIDEIII